eukprot:g11873.t1
MMGHLLREHEVDLACNGAEGLDKLMSKEYDIVLTDISMPVMDGTECVRRFREWEKEHRTTRQPIYSMSANAVEVDSGFDGSLPKPIDSKRLRGLLQRVSSTAQAGGVIGTSTLPSTASALGDPRTSAFVDASQQTTVTVDAPLFDTNDSTANGCDPAGCQGAMTRDGDLAQVSRWSCKPALGPAGSECSITYKISDPLRVYGLNIAMYKGDTRTRTIDIYVDGLQTDTWTSSGTTTAFETVKLGFYYTSSTSSYECDHPGLAVENTIELRGDLVDSEWLSILEVEILVDDGSGADDGCDTDDDTAGLETVEAGTLGTVVATSTLYDPNLSDANGCDPAGCTASLTRDGDLSPSSRWSCSPKLGGECTISYDLGAVYDLAQLRLAMYKGTTRQRTMEVYVDGVLVTTWTSSGTTDSFENISMSGSTGQVVEVTGVLGAFEWLSIIEAEIMVVTDGSTPPPALTPPTPVPATPTTAPPAPSPTAYPTPDASATDSPTAPPPTGDLQVVGPLPLADASGSSDLELYYLKDGDFSTSWTCTGDPRDPDDATFVYDCTIYFDLVSYRHIKEVRIAMPDGAERSVNLSIAGKSGPPGDSSFLTSSGTVDGFITSSGQTDGLEAYEFDYFTDVIAISGVFSTSDESITISEVEFVEEVFPGELPVVFFSSFPSDIGETLYTTFDAFMWRSDSPEATGAVLQYELNSYATVDALELEFPVGDTYKFDVELYNDAADYPWEDVFATITGIESEDVDGWQSFDLSSAADQYVTTVKIVMQGTRSGAPGFKLLDSRVMGTTIDNPTGVLHVGSTRVEDWDYQRYPDFVALGTGDQRSIMEAICTVKKTSFDGVDCAGEGDETATGTVSMPAGDWFVDGNIFMKSGVHLEGWFSHDDQPGTTEVYLEEGAAGNTAVEAVLVIDGVSDAKVESFFMRGLFDPDTDLATAPVSGLGTTGVLIANSQNVTCENMDIRNFDGDAMVVRDSNVVNIDGRRYDHEFGALDLGKSRGTGLVVDASDSVWMRRHHVEQNGVAGIRIMASNNFTFEGPRSTSEPGDAGQAYVGSSDGPQPIELIVESSTLVAFNDVYFFSANDPVMTISADSSVAFNVCSFYQIEAGTCVIEAEDPSVVTTGDDDELTLEGNCFVKV